MPTKPPSAGLQTVLASVAHQVREIMQTRFLRAQDVAAERAGLFRCLRGRENYKLSTLVTLAEALGFDLVIRFRARPSPPEVPHGSQENV